MKSAIPAVAAGVGMGISVTLMAPFSAAAQDQRCAPLNVLKYDLRDEGQTLQSRSRVASDGHDDHKIEMYGNTETGKWTLVEIRGNEKPCYYSSGSVFFNENPRKTESTDAVRHSAMALHGNGNGSNKAYEIYAHMKTGRWFLSRLTSPDNATIVLAGDGYEKYNNAPFEPVRRIDFQLE